MDQVTLRRLSLIKYYHQLASKYSSCPEPLCFTSILLFHDAIELFLQLASESFNVGKKQTGFMEYFDLLKPKMPDNQNLSQKEAMRKLNRARVAFKHHGTMPSKTDVETFKITASNFFEENTPIIFGMSFSEVSLVDLVQPPKAQNTLKEAKVNHDNNNYQKSINSAALAVQQMLDDYEERKEGRYRESPFFFGHDLSWLSSDDLGDDAQYNMRDFVDHVKESLEAIQQAVKILALGLDYRKYSRMKLLSTVIIIRLGDGEYRVYESGWRHQINPAEDDSNFCIEFAIETSIRLQEFDYDVPKII